MPFRARRGDFLAQKPPSGRTLLPGGQNAQGLSGGKALSLLQPPQKQQGLLFPGGALQGWTQVHHLKLYRTAAAKFVDLQIKGYIHPSPGLAGALLGSGGKEYALQLHRAFGKPQLEVAILPHTLHPVQRDAQQTEQRTVIAVSIRLQTAKLLHLPERYQLRPAQHHIHIQRRGGGTTA